VVIPKGNLLFACLQNRFPPNYPIPKPFADLLIAKCYIGDEVSLRLTHPLCAFFMV